MRAIPQAALEIVAKWEAFRAVAYLCPAGVPTIGFGHTKSVTQEDVGKKEIRRSTAFKLLREDMGEAQTRLYAVLPKAAIEKLSENQYAALLSFVFNVGAKSSWTIWRLVRDGALERVPGELARFVNAGGKRLQGLVNRRRDEIDLWLRADGEKAEPLPPPEPIPPPTAVPPVEPEEPVAPAPIRPRVEPANPMKETRQSRTFWSGIATFVTAMGAAVGAMVEQLTPFAAKAPWISGMVVLLILAAGFLGVVVAFLRWQDIRGSQA